MVQQKTKAQARREMGAAFKRRIEESGLSQSYIIKEAKKLGVDFDDSKLNKSLNGTRGFRIEEVNALEAVLASGPRDRRGLILSAARVATRPAGQPLALPDDAELDEVSEIEVWRSTAGRAVMRLPFSSGREMQLRVSLEALRKLRDDLADF